jgi:hypothetical protein
MDPDAVRALALALPETTEHRHHGRPSFRVRNRIFAVVRDDGRLTLKLDVAAEEALIGSDPATFERLPGGWAGKGWVWARLDRIEPAELRELLEEAWLGVAPKRVSRAYPAASGTAPETI